MLLLILLMEVKPVSSTNGCVANVMVDTVATVGTVETAVVSDGIHCNGCIPRWVV